MLYFAFPLLLLGLHALGKPYVYKKKHLYNFLYWFSLLNLGIIYSYIPTRLFSAALPYLFGISPWIILLPGSLFVSWGMWWFLRMEIQRSFAVNAMRGKKKRRLYVLATVLPLFGYFGGLQGLLDPHLASHIFGYIALALVPFCLWKVKI